MQKLSIALASAYSLLISYNQVGADAITDIDD